MLPFRQKLKHNLILGRADLVLAEIMKATQPLDDQQHHNNAVLLWSRLQENEKQQMRNTITPDDYARENNKINQALLVLIDALTDDVFSETSPAAAAKQPGSEKRFWKNTKGVGLIVGILSGLVAVAQAFFGSSTDPGSMQLTVYVQDAEGKPVPALQNTGRVKVIFGDDLRFPVVGENGRSNIGEIPVKFQGQD